MKLHLICILTFEDVKFCSYFFQNAFYIFQILHILIRFYIACAFPVITFFSFGFISISTKKKPFVSMIGVTFFFYQFEENWNPNNIESSKQ